VPGLEVTHLRHWFLLALAGTFAAGTCAADTPELDVAYVETPADGIELMLEMARVGPGDYVVDLGTGDGRIVIAAVKRGAIGLGIDLDPQRVREADVNATLAGVSSRVLFLEQDLFDTDFSQATVVTLFLNYAVNLRLRPKLLEQLKPGTRVVSHNFDMDEWQPDKHQQFLRNANGNFYIHDIYLWVIPADVAGTWQGSAGEDQFQMHVSQTFQRLTVESFINGRALITEEASLIGDRISFIGQDPTKQSWYLFSGTIDDNGIGGIAQFRTTDVATTKRWSVSRQPAKD
jgi:predicted O-methyltransferase YrrM